MKFAFFGYRDWAYKILDNIKENFDIDEFTQRNLGNDFQIKRKLDDFNYKSYSALLFYGWSWMIQNKIINDKPCICLHPSPLPKYRGGSPLQNQIINNEIKSAVTLFRMSKRLDEGDIYYQKEFSLEGNLDEIYNRISNIGIELTIKLLKDFENNQVKTYEQDNAKATLYKRRKPIQSELKISELKEMTARQVYNRIRATQSQGYPNAYIVGKDGKKVFLTNSKLED